MTTRRLDWDESFMAHAQIAALRSTCLPVPNRRPDEPAGGRRVGCVIVVDRRIVASGYNGSLPGAPHCSDAAHGHLHDEEGNCVRTVHAEANAVADAAARSARIEGGTAYVTFQPCLVCFKLLVAAGVIRIVCGESYDLAREDSRLVRDLMAGLDGRVFVETFRGRRVQITVPDE